MERIKLKDVRRGDIVTEHGRRYRATEDARVMVDEIHDGYECRMESLDGMPGKLIHPFFEARYAGPYSLRLTLVERPSFQTRVDAWLIECFGERIARDKAERNHRFLEEAIELVQACGCTASEAHQLVDYVFGRPVGERAQEVGGVMVTLAALCMAQEIGMEDAGEVELARIWTKVPQIRAKQAAKPKHSPLAA